MTGRALTDDGVDIFRLARTRVLCPFDVKEFAGAECERERFGEVAQVVVNFGGDERCELARRECRIFRECFTASRWCVGGDQ